MQLTAFSLLHIILTSINYRMERNTVLFFLSLGCLFLEAMPLSLFPPVKLTKVLFKETTPQRVLAFILRVSFNSPMV